MKLKMTKSTFNFKNFILLKFFLFFLIFSFESYSDTLNISEKLITLGSNKAPVKIKVFSSHTCPHCAKFHVEVVSKLKKNYIEADKVQLIFIDFPLDHAALNTSKLSYCLNAEKQILFLDNIYENQNKWTNGKNIEEINNNLKKIAKIYGINSSQFDDCINNDNIEDSILSGRIEAQKKYSINSTPTIVINEKKLKNPVTFENIKKEIEKII